VSLTDYSLGIAYLTITGLAIGLVSCRIRRMLTPGWTGARARLVEVVVALATLVVLMEALGSFALLTPVGLLAVLLVLAALTWYLCRRIDVPEAARVPPSSPPRRRWESLLALAVVGVTTLRWAGGVGESLAHGIYRQDSVWYHLPFAAGIFQSADTWAVRLTDPMALTAWFYPQNSELLHSLGMLAWGTDYLSPLLNLGWLALAFLAAWCLGRPFGREAGATIAVATVLGTEMMQAQAGNAPNDIAGIALLLACAAILVNALGAGADAGAGGGAGATAGREGPLGALFVAGLAAGLAIGTKLPLLAPVGVITVGLLWVLRRGGRRPAASWIGALLLGGGYWYLRNLVHAGDPLPWIAGGPLPGPDQASLYPRAPHSVADYATSFGVWTDTFVPALADAIGPLWPLVLLGAAAGLVLAIVRGPALELILGLAGVAAILAYIFIPVSASGGLGHPVGFSTNLRYLSPALALGLVLLPVQLRRLGVGRRLVALPLAGVFVVDALNTSDWWPGTAATDLALVGLLVAALVVAAWAIPGPASRRRRLLAVSLAAALVAVVLGYPSERDYFHHRYDPALAPVADSPGFRDSHQWRRIQSWAQDQRDATIGVVGPPGRLRPVPLLRPRPHQPHPLRRPTGSRRRLPSDLRLRDLAPGRERRGPRLRRRHPRHRDRPRRHPAGEPLDGARDPHPGGPSGVAGRGLPDHRPARPGRLPATRPASGPRRPRRRRRDPALTLSGRSRNRPGACRGRRA
jgi:hypothetical protein